MKLRVCYSFGDKPDATCKVEIPQFVVDSKDRAKIQAAVASAVGVESCRLRWATDMSQNIIVADLPPEEVEKQLQSTGAEDSVPPTEVELVALATAPDGLKTLREMVAHFNVGDAIGYTPGLPAKSISDKLIALWHPKKESQSDGAGKPVKKSA